MSFLHFALTSILHLLSGDAMGIMYPDYNSYSHLTDIAQKDSKVRMHDSRSLVV